MTDRPETTSPPTGNRTTRTLRTRYLGVLACVAALVVLHQVVIQPALVHLDHDAPVINVAGRQRMLSQRLTKAALALRLVEDAETRRRRTTELAQVLEEWSAAHHALQDGDESLGLPGTSSAAIRESFAELQPHFEAMHTAGQAIAHLEAASPPANEPIEPHVQTIVAREAKYLPVMDRIVGQFEDEARDRVAGLRLTGFAIMAAILVLLLGVGLFVLQPATRLIGRQITRLTESEAELRTARDELEERVRERTAQLTESNAALEHEIDERRRIEQRSRELHDQLAHASRVTAVGQLATGLAHELNQPLGAIANYAEVADLLLEAPEVDRERAADAVHGIRASAHRAGNVIRRMRSFLQGRAAERRPTDVGHLLREVVEFCRPETARADVEVRLDVCEVPPVEVDPVQIQQVLVNLVQNAVQSMQRVDRTQRVLAIRANAERGCVCVSVEDSGPGFDVDPETLFDEFRTTREGGLGLGLSISRSIVRQHRGEMSAGRGSLGGAKLAFTLPDSDSAEAEPARESQEVARVGD